MPGTPKTDSATSVFGVDSTQRYQVVAQTRCRRITLHTVPVSAILMSAPSNRNYKGRESQITVPSGSPAVFTPNNGEWFTPGQVVGDIQIPQGSCTAHQSEGS
jgi:hypothetical protein